MVILLILMATAIVGGIIGRQFKKRKIEIKGYAIIQAVTVFILIFFMGTKIGADDRILDSIKAIGMSAVIVTVATMAGSLIFVFGLRKFFKLNREGVKADD